MSPPGWSTRCRLVVVTKRLQVRCMIRTSPYLLVLVFGTLENYSRTVSRQCRILARFDTTAARNQQRNSRLQSTNLQRLRKALRLCGSSLRPPLGESLVDRTNQSFNAGNFEASSLAWVGEGQTQLKPAIGQWHLASAEISCILSRCTRPYTLGGFGKHAS